MKYLALSNVHSIFTILALKMSCNMVFVDKPKWIEAMELAKRDSNNATRTSKWRVGSSDNVCVVNDVHWFKNFHPLSHSAKLITGDMQILGGGDVVLPMCDARGNVALVELQNVAYAPDARNNILSVSWMVQSGQGLSFSSN